ncbi:hypothetical protein EVAR_93251_1 [Eumeta japonica]|uniref:Uncharacterized protein n=1 Tax=Eumeta variegata TaxID=151549 RepID=A0A4C1TXN1_EUMVA|nr:hypothetical protein EVAR_93251_1 [Eumeta japonica]
MSHLEIAAKLMHPSQLYLNIETLFISLPAHSMNTCSEATVKENAQCGLKRRDRRDSEQHSDRADTALGGTTSAVGNAENGPSDVACCLAGLLFKRQMTTRVSLYVIWWFVASRRSSKG